MFAHILVFCTRLLLILLFFPFSALDKVVNFSSALVQARAHAPNRAFASLLIAAGFCVEVFMSLGVLTGIADRACAVVLGVYCLVTAVLWKQFWRGPDFRLFGPSQSREMFWDFLKNFAVAGGFFVLALGQNAATVDDFLAAPFASHDLNGWHGGGAP
jgi:putative oxidoreductase